MSDVDKLKDETEKKAGDHPQQVSEGERAIGETLGMDSEEDQTSRHDQNTPPQDAEAAEAARPGD